MHDRGGLLDIVAADIIDVDLYNHLLLRWVVAFIRPSTMTNHSWLQLDVCRCFPCQTGSICTLSARHMGWELSWAWYGRSNTAVHWWDHCCAWPSHSSTYREMPSTSIRSVVRRRMSRGKTTYSAFRAHCPSHNWHQSR